MRDETARRPSPHARGTVGTRLDVGGIVASERGSRRGARRTREDDRSGAATRD